MSETPNVFSWASLNAALKCGKAHVAASTAREGLRVASFDGRKEFFSQLSLTLLPLARASETAGCVAEACEMLWGMSEFRTNHSFPSSLAGEALLLASALGTAFAAINKHEKAMTFDVELLQSPAFFTYEGLSPLDRLACVARVLKASRLTANPRHVDSAVQKGMSLYHSIASQTDLQGDDDNTQSQHGAVVCAYLLELGLYRQEHHDYLRAFQSFLVLHEKSKDAVTLRRAALCALCARTGEGERQAALYSVIQRSSITPLPPQLHASVQSAYNGQLLSASDTRNVLAVSGDYMSPSTLRGAIREHNIVILARTFDCVHWRSLCVHMDDEQMTEAELYDLLVSMVVSQRICAVIHQDTGFVEFTDAAGKHARITDTDAFNRITVAIEAIGKAHPELLFV